MTNMTLLWTIFGLFGASLACLPMRIHYQSTYCDSTVAAIVNITSGAADQCMTPRVMLNYEGDLLLLQKGTIYDVGWSGKVKVLTAGMLNSCGPVCLEVGKTYMILGDKAGDGRIAAKLFNGATKMNEHSEIGSLLDQVKKYDCSCKVRTQFYGPIEMEQPVESNECSPTYYNCKWDKGSCRMNDGRCEWTYDCPDKDKE